MTIQHMQPQILINIMWNIYMQCIYSSWFVILILLYSVTVFELLRIIGIYACHENVTMQTINIGFIVSLLRL